MMNWIWSNGNLVTLLGGLIILLGSGIAYVGVYATNKASDLQGAKIADKSEEIAIKSNRIEQLSIENADLNRQLAAYATGGDSYIYLHIEDFGTDSPKALIRHVGQYPVRDIELLIYDVTDQLGDIDAGRISKYDLVASPKSAINLTVVHPDWIRNFKNFPFESNPVGDRYGYFLHFDAHNGRVRQHIRLMRVDGTWQTAYQVDKPVADRFELMIQHKDLNYPAAGEITVNELIPN